MTTHGPRPVLLQDIQLLSESGRPLDCGITDHAPEMQARLREAVAVDAGRIMAIVQNHPNYNAILRYDMRVDANTVILTSRRTRVHPSQRLVYSFSSDHDDCRALTDPAYRAIARANDIWREHYDHHPDHVPDDHPGDHAASPASSFRAPSPPLHHSHDVRPLSPSAGGPHASHSTPRSPSSSPHAPSGMTLRAVRRTDGLGRERIRQLMREVVRTMGDANRSLQEGDAIMRLRKKNPQRLAHQFAELARLRDQVARLTHELGELVPEAVTHRDALIEQLSQLQDRIKAQYGDIDKALADLEEDPSSARTPHHSRISRLPSFGSSFPGHAPTDSPSSHARHPHAGRHDRLGATPVSGYPDLDREGAEWDRFNDETERFLTGEPSGDHHEEMPLGDGAEGDDSVRVERHPSGVSGSDPASRSGPRDASSESGLPEISRDIAEIERLLAVVRRNLHGDPSGDPHSGSDHPIDGAADRASRSGSPRTPSVPSRLLPHSHSPSDDPVNPLRHLSSPSASNPWETPTPSRRGRSGSPSLALHSLPSGDAPRGSAVDVDIPATRRRREALTQSLRDLRASERPGLPRPLGRDARIEQLEHDLAGAKADHQAALRHAQRALGQMAAEGTTLRQDLERTTGELARAKGEVSGLQHQVARLVARGRTLESLRQRLVAAQIKDNGNRERELEYARHFDALREEMQGLKDQLTDASHALREAEGQVRAKDGEIAEIVRGKDAEIAELRAALDESVRAQRHAEVLQLQIRELGDALRQEQLKVRELAARVHSGDERAQALESALANTRSAHRAVASKLTDLTTSNKRLTRAHAALQKEMEEAVRDAKKAEQQIHRLGRELADSRGQLAEAERLHTQDQDEIREATVRAEMQLAQAQVRFDEAIQRLEARVAELDEDNAGLRHRLTELTREYQEGRGQIGRLESTIAGLESDNAILRTQLASQKSYYQGLLAEQTRTADARHRDLSEQLANEKELGRESRAHFESVIEALKREHDSINERKAGKLKEALLQAARAEEHVRALESSNQELVARASRVEQEDETIRDELLRAQRQITAESEKAHQAREAANKQIGELRGLTEEQADELRTAATHVAESERSVARLQKEKAELTKTLSQERAAHEEAQNQSRHAANELRLRKDALEAQVSLLGDELATAKHDAGVEQDRLRALLARASTENSDLQAEIDAQTEAVRAAEGRAEQLDEQRVELNAELERNRVKYTGIIERHRKEKADLQQQVKELERQKIDDAALLKRQHAAYLKQLRKETGATRKVRAELQSQIRAVAAAKHESEKLQQQYRALKLQHTETAARLEESGERNTHLERNLVQARADKERAESLLESRERDLRSQIDALTQSNHGLNADLRARAATIIEHETAIAGHAEEGAALIATCERRVGDASSVAEEFRKANAVLRGQVRELEAAKEEAEGAALAAKEELDKLGQAKDEQEKGFAAKIKEQEEAVHAAEKRASAAEAERDSNAERIRALEADVDEQRRLAASESERAGGLSSRLATLEREMSSQLRARDTRVSEVQASYDELQIRSAFNASQHTRYAARAKTLEVELGTLRAEKESAESTGATSKAEVAKLRDALKELQERQDTVVKKKDKYSARYRELHGQLEQLRKEAEAEQAAFTSERASLNGQIIRLRDELRVQTEEAAAQGKGNQSLHRTIDQLQATIREQGTSAAHLAKAKGELETALRLEREKASGQLKSTLEEARRAMESNKQELGKLQVAAAKRESELQAELDRNTSAHRKLHDTHGELSRETNRLRAELASEQARLADARDSLGTKGQKERERADKAEKDVEGLTAALATKTREQETAATRIATLESANSKLQAQIAALPAHIEKIENEFQVRQREWEEHVRGARADRTRVEELLHAKADELLSVTRQLEEAQRQLETSQRTELAAKSALAELQVDMEQLRETAASSEARSLTRYDFREGLSGDELRRTLEAQMPPARARVTPPRRVWTIEGLPEAVRGGLIDGLLAPDPETIRLVRATLNDYLDHPDANPDYIYNLAIYLANADSAQFKSDAAVFNKLCNWLIRKAWQEGRAYPEAEGHKRKHTTLLLALANADNALYGELYHRLETAPGFHEFLPGPDDDHNTWADRLLRADPAELEPEQVALQAALRGVSGVSDPRERQAQIRKILDNPLAILRTYELGTTEDVAPIPNATARADSTLVVNSITAALDRARAAQTPLTDEQRAGFATTVGSRIMAHLSQLTGMGCGDSTPATIMKYVQAHGELPPAIERAFNQENGEDALLLAELLYYYNALTQGRTTNPHFAHFATIPQFAWLLQDVPPHIAAGRVFQLLHTLAQDLKNFQGRPMSSQQAIWAEYLYKLLANKGGIEHIIALPGSGKSALYQCFLGYIKKQMPECADKHVVLFSPFAVADKEGIVCRMLPRRITGNISVPIEREDQIDRTVVIADEGHVLPAETQFVISAPGASRERTVRPVRFIDPMMVTATPVIPHKRFAVRKDAELTGPYTGQVGVLKRRAAKLRLDKNTEAIRLQHEQLKHARSVLDAFRTYSTGGKKAPTFQEYVPGGQSRGYEHDHRVMETAFKRAADAVNAYEALREEEEDASAEEVERAIGNVERAYAALNEPLLAFLVRLSNVRYYKFSCKGHTSLSAEPGTLKTSSEDATKAMKKDTVAFCRELAGLFGMTSQRLPAGAVQELFNAHKQKDGVSEDLPGVHPQLEAMLKPFTHLTKAVASKSRRRTHTVPSLAVSTHKPAGPSSERLQELEQEEASVSKAAVALDRRIGGWHRKAEVEHQEALRHAAIQADRVAQIESRMAYGQRELRPLDASTPVQIARDIEALATTPGNIKTTRRAQVILPGVAFTMDSMIAFTDGLSRQLSAEAVTYPLSVVYHDSVEGSEGFGKDWVIVYKEPGVRGRAPISKDAYLADPALTAGTTILLYDTTNKQGGDFVTLSDADQGDMAQFIYYNYSDTEGENPADLVSENDLYQAILRRRGNTRLPSYVFGNQTVGGFRRDAQLRQENVSKAWAIRGVASEIARKDAHAHTVFTRGRHAWKTLKGVGRRREFDAMVRPSPGLHAALSSAGDTPYDHQRADDQRMLNHREIASRMAIKADPEAAPPSEHLWQALLAHEEGNILLQETRPGSAPRSTPPRVNPWGPLEAPGSDSAASPAPTSRSMSSADAERMRLALAGSPRRSSSSSSSTQRSTEVRGKTESAGPKIAHRPASGGSAPSSSSGSRGSTPPERVSSGGGTHSSSKKAPASVVSVTGSVKKTPGAARPGVPTATLSRPLDLSASIRSTSRPDPSQFQLLGGTGSSGDSSRMPTPEMDDSANALPSRDASRTPSPDDVAPKLALLRTDSVASSAASTRGFPSKSRPFDRQASPGTPSEDPFRRRLVIETSMEDSVDTTPSTRSASPPIGKTLRNRPAPRAQVQQPLRMHGKYFT